MKVAVITPHYKPKSDWFMKCVESVEEQEYKCTHIIVCDGSDVPSKSILEKKHVQLVTFQIRHNDAGDTPRAVGSISAFNQGFDAIAYLDDDNWYKSNHIKNMVNCFENYNSSICASSRLIYDLDSNFMGDCYETHPDKFIDTNCYFITKYARKMVNIWWQMSKQQHKIDDRIFLRAIKENNIDFHFSNEKTVCYRTSYIQHYKYFNLPVPENFKSIKNLFDFVEFINVVLQYYKEKSFDEAKMTYQQILSQLGGTEQIVKNIKSKFQQSDQLLKTIGTLGNFCREVNFLDHAVIYYNAALQIDSNSLAAHNNLGLIYKSQGKINQAIEEFEKATKINPESVEALTNLGDSYLNVKKLNVAEEKLLTALKLEPKLKDAYLSLTSLYTSVGNLDKAIKLNENALKFIDDASIFNDLGSLYFSKGEESKAILNYKKAISLDSRHADSYINLGLAMESQHNTSEAIICFEKGLDLSPNNGAAMTALFYIYQDTCQWNKLADIRNKLTRHTEESFLGIHPIEETAFISVSSSDNPELNFKIATLWSKKIQERASLRGKKFIHDLDNLNKKNKIRLGYLSRDYFDHPTAHLMLSLFKLHDRKHFEVFLYSYGPDDTSSYRKTIIEDSDKFVEISNMSDYEAAKKIFEDKIDLLIDLKGLTQKNRLGIFSYKPAPIQATYLGFPGTTGANFIDYIITDKIVSPAIHKNFYSENFAYLPHCYQVNDNKQKISSNVYKRSDFNISKDAFVYGSFNQSFKLDVTTLDTWSNILLKSEKSIIVLIKRNDLSESNIKSYFSKKGINEERIIFVDRLPKDSHLARLKLVDLVLDTRIYNGHTTTSDALWAGVPVITCAGNHFASRVSESILRSAGMNRLIVNSLEEYEELAIKLSSDKILFQQIKDEMNKNIKSSPLFDTELFCGNLEKIYKQMIQIARNKEMSRQIDLADEKE